jgi:3-oxoacyl-[acyl-carrier protein] reductase
VKHIALVTGGSRGIGRAIALELARNGYDIWLNFLKNTEAAEEVRSEILGLKRECTLLQFDIGDQKAVEKTLRAQIGKLKNAQERITVLVNNAGLIRDNLFYWMDFEDWDAVIRTHLYGFFHVTKCVIEHMVSIKQGNIINISSLSGLIGNRGQLNYSAAKAGLIAATKSLSKEFGSSNIRVNSVAPGLISTEMTEGDVMNEKEVKRFIPLRRLGKPEEVAKVVSFLCSEGASYITGAVIPVTGGLY